MYCGYITKIKSIKPIPNADRLQLATVFTNDVVVSLDFKEGDIVVYFPVDGQLGIEFAKTNNLLRLKDENGNLIMNGYLDPEKRNIKAIKLRGEKSDGIILHLTSLCNFTDISKLKIGDQITILNGVEICCKYIPKTKCREHNIKSTNKTKRKVIKEVNYVFFEEHKDTSQLAYNLNQFKTGDICTISAKLHGTSMRFSNTIKETYKKQNFIQKLFRQQKKIIRQWEEVSGSRRVVLTNFDGGFYGGNAFRKTYHDLLKDKLPKGMTIYGEIVGFLENGTPIMPSGDNKKVNDKKFVKQYGEKTVFSYNCKLGENHLYVYRITMTNEDGYIVELPTWQVKDICEKLGLDFVPILDQFIYTNEEDLMNRVNQWLDIPDVIGKTHVSEGVVVRIENRESFVALKHKSYCFKMLEGLIKESATQPDIEEEQESNND